LKRQSERHPNLLKPHTITSRIEPGAKVLLQLTRIDKYNFNTEIKPALQWAETDDFWSKNVLSPAGLRKKGSNGEMKFVNILASMQRDTGKKKVEKESKQLDWQQQDFIERKMR
jgi:hypothetical protein